MQSWQEKMMKLTQQPSDIILSDLEVTAQRDYGKTAVGMRLGLSELGIPVIRVGKINESGSVEMYLDYDALMELRAWTGEQMKRMEKEANG